MTQPEMVDIGSDNPNRLTCSLCDYRTHRHIPSMGIHYTMEELPSEGNVRLFRYVYIEKEQHGAS